MMELNPVSLPALYECFSPRTQKKSQSSPVLILKKIESVAHTDRHGHARTTAQPASSNSSIPRPASMGLCALHIRSGAGLDWNQQDQSGQRSRGSWSAKERRLHGGPRGRGALGGTGRLNGGHGAGQVQDILEMYFWKYIPGDILRYMSKRYFWNFWSNL